MEIHSSPQAAASKCPQPDCLCQEIADEVRDIAIALFGGHLNANLFEKSVVALEAAKVQRFGFRLTAERLPRGISRFHLSHALTGETCATMDFNSVTKALEVHHLCG